MNIHTKTRKSAQSLKEVVFAVVGQDVARVSQVTEGFNVHVPMGMVHLPIIMAEIHRRMTLSRSDAVRYDKIMKDVFMIEG